MAEWMYNKLSGSLSVSLSPLHMNKYMYLFYKAALQQWPLYKLKWIKSCAPFCPRKTPVQEITDSPISPWLLYKLLTATLLYTAFMHSHQWCYWLPGKNAATLLAFIDLFILLFRRAFCVNGLLLIVELYRTKLLPRPLGVGKYRLDTDGCKCEVLVDNIMLLHYCKSVCVGVVNDRNAAEPHSSRFQAWC